MAASVSDVINDALAERERQDREALDYVRETAARADQGKMTRVLAHIDRQAAALPATCPRAVTRSRRHMFLT